MALGTAEWLVELVLLLLMVALGWSVRWRDAAERLTDRPWLATLFYLVPVCLLFGGVSALFSAVRTLLVARRFGLSTQGGFDWLADQLKGAAVGGTLVTVAVSILYALLRRFPSTWWIWSGAAFSLILVLFAFVAPVVIFPLFFRFTRITAPEITERLEHLASRAGTHIEGIYEVAMSRKNKAANAALIGLGRTRRIALADNLLDNFTLDEIEAVLAHEFAHHNRRHQAKGIALQSAMFFAVLGGVHVALGHLGGRFGFREAADIANFPLIVLTAMVLGLITLPVVNAILRSFEREADELAIAWASRPRAFCSALRRLAQINLVDPSPNPLIESVFYSHPSIERRVERAEAVLREQEREANAAQICE